MTSWQSAGSPIGVCRKPGPIGLILRGENFAAYSRRRTSGLGADRFTLSRVAFVQRGFLQHVPHDA